MITFLHILILIFLELPCIGIILYHLVMPQEYCWLNGWQLVGFFIFVCFLVSTIERTLGIDDE
jgi:hypothetical protein